MKRVDSLAGALLLVVMTAVIAWPIIGVIGVIALAYTAVRSIAAIHALDQFFSGKPLHRPSAPQLQSRGKQSRQRAAREETRRPLQSDGARSNLPNGRKVLHETGRARNLY